MISKAIYYRKNETYIFPLVDDVNDDNNNNDDVS